MLMLTLALAAGLSVGALTAPTASAAPAALAAPAAAAAAGDPPCTISATLVNSCRPWLGAAAGGYPGTSGFKNRILEQEARIGRQDDIVHDYLGQGSVLSADDISLAQRPGTIALVNWKAADVWSNANGTNATVNAQIDRMAASVKSLGSTKIMLAIFHEPENDISAGGDPACPTVSFGGHSGSVSDYVDMWHNVRARFDAAGVTNVVWVMNYMGWKTWNCVVPHMWPGNDYVDWVTWDPYPKTATWTAFVNLFYNYLSTHSDATHDYLSKPWGLSEFGYVGSSQTAAYAMYDEARRDMTTGYYSRLKAYVVWDYKASGTHDDRVRYDENAVVDQVEQDHFNAWANDPMLTGTAAPGPGDTAAPTVAVSSPAAGDTVSGVVPVHGSASDDTGVTAAGLLVDGNRVSAVPVGTGGSLSVSWNSGDVANGTHSLQLSASDAAGHTTLSDPVGVDVENVDSTPPTAPTGLTATVSGGTATLTWTAGHDDHAVVAQRVYRDGSLLATLGGTETTYDDPGLDQFSSHGYTVTALDAAGNESAASNTAHVDVGDSTPPDAPVLSAALTGATGAALSWTTPSAADLAGFDVLRDGLVVATVDASATGWNDSALLDGRTYRYTVEAFDTAGNRSVPSNEAPVSTPDTTKPAAPTKLAGVVSGSTVKLTWTAATDNVGVTSYRVYRGTTLLGSSTTPAYTDTAPLSTGTYTVRAVDGAGNVSDPSAAVTVALKDTTAPTAPGSLKAVAGTKQVTLTWTAASDNVGVTKYYLYRGNAKYKLLGPVLTYTDTGLTSGTTYTYKVYAIDAAGNWSSPTAKVSARAG
jgi:fibronectin type 3 domain-containing protein